ncbi:MAG: PepSY domain-containing protein [Actinomycetota bacterium]
MKTDIRPTDDPDVDVDIDGRVVLPAPPRRDRRIPLPSRTLMLKIHRWLSLGGLVWILIIALTGAVLVFAPQITAWSRPELFKATAGDKGPQAMVDASIARFPDQDVAVDHISFPVDNRGVYVLHVTVSTRATAEQLATGAPIERKSRSWLVYLDPGTGTINGARPEASGFIYWCKRGHYVLWQDNGFLGIDGDDLAGLVALSMLFITLIGFYIWYFPKVKHWFRNLRIRTKRGFFLFNLDLHRTLGLLVLLPLTVISFTGAAFSYPDMKLVWERLTPAKHDYVQHEPEEPPASEEPGEDEEPSPVLTTDGAWQLLKERYPNYRLNSLEPPLETADVWGAYLTRGYSPRQRDNTSGNMYVAIDRFSHEVIYEGTPEQGNVWDQLWEDWSLPLHAGDFLGNTSRWIWLFVGLSPVVLSGTGVVVWWKRRQRRQARPAAAPAGLRSRNGDGAAGDTGPVVIDLTNHGQPPRPAELVDRLTELFITRVGPRARVRVRGPVRLDDAYQPEPDIAVVRTRPYGDGHPGAADTLLVVEVTDPEADDRDVKLLIYALAGVPEVWFVDPDAETVDVHTGPRPSGWAKTARHRAGATLEPVAIEGTSFTVDELLGSTAPVS